MLLYGWPNGASINGRSAARRRTHTRTLHTRSGPVFQAIVPDRSHLAPLGAPSARYFRVTAAPRSTSLMLASVHSHASTSANSSSRFARSPRARARASSPNSSLNHSHVPGVPRARSADSYFFAMCAWKADSVSVRGSGGRGSGVRGSMARFYAQQGIVRQTHETDAERAALADRRVRGVA